MRVKYFLIVLLSLINSIFLSCGKAEDEMARLIFGKNPVPQETPIPRSIQIPLFLAATSWNVDITNCASGKNYSNYTGSTVAMYAEDMGCKVLLKSFDWDGKTWTNAQGCCTTEDPVVFTAAADSRQLIVKAVERLPSPLTDGAVARFSFQEISLGAGKSLLAFGSAGGHDSASYKRPNMQIKPSLGFVWSALSPFPDNIATFQIKLECLADLTSANTACPASDLQDQIMSDLRLAIVQDSFNNSPTWNESQTAMNDAISAGKAVQVNAGNYLAPGAGFKGGACLNLDGPGNVVNNKNMLLLVEYIAPAPENNSYIYFNVDFAASLSLSDIWRKYMFNMQEGR